MGVVWGIAGIFGAWEAFAWAATPPLVWGSGQWSRGAWA